MSATRLVREPERREITGVPASTWANLIQDGLAPPPIRISKRAVGWPETELRTLNAARVACHSDEAIRGHVRKMLEARARQFEELAQ